MQWAGCREDDQVLSRLRACLKTFEGSRAFHNYTKRRLYRLPVRPPKPAQAAGDSDNTPIGASAMVPSSQDQVLGRSLRQQDGKPQKHSRRLSTATDGVVPGSAALEEEPLPADDAVRDELNDGADVDVSTDPAEMWPQRALQFRSVPPWLVLVERWN